MGGGKIRAQRRALSGVHVHGRRRHRQSPAAGDPRPRSTVCRWLVTGGRSRDRSPEQRVPIGIEDAVVDLVHRDRARKRGQLEGLFRSDAALRSTSRRHGDTLSRTGDLARRARTPAARSAIESRCVCHLDRPLRCSVTGPRRSRPGFVVAWSSCGGCSGAPQMIEPSAYRLRPRAAIQNRWSAV